MVVQMNSVSPQGSILDQAESCTLLHRGGEADVYAIKAHGNELVLKWYGRENRFDESVVTTLEHLNIPGLYRIRESGRRENTAYLLYDFVPGASSVDVSPMPVAVALSLLRELGRTLDALAHRDVHHGDLNPTNVVICPSKDGALAVLIDCGIVGPGALAYAAPERFQGKPASVKGDLFSIALMLFYWISGRNLLEASDFDGYAAQSASIDSVDVTGILYGTGMFSVEELSAMTPLWQSLLRSDPDERAEDFDELDELLEIALSALEVGDVRLRLQLQQFSKEVVEKKSELKIPPDAPCNEKAAFPYRKKGAHSPKKNRKIIFLGIFGLILLLVALWYAFGTKSPDIDATGNLLLEKSRNLESVDTEDDILRGTP